MKINQRYVTKKDIKYITPTNNTNERTVTIELPSKGELYPTDSYLADGKINFRYMKGRDEDIFSNPTYMKSGETINMLLKHLCVDDKFEPYDLIISDWLYTVVSVRVMNLGQNVSVKDIVCPKCSHTNPAHSFDLSEIKDDEKLAVPSQVGENKFPFTLPISGDNIVMKILDGHSVKTFKQMFEKSELSDRLYSIMLALAIVDAQDTMSTVGDTLRYLDEMPIGDKKFIRTKLNEISGVTTAKIDYTCPKCGHTKDFSIPTDESFFFPEL